MLFLRKAKIFGAITKFQCIFDGSRQVVLWHIHEQNVPPTVSLCALRVADRLIDPLYEAIADQDSEPNDGGCISSWSDLRGPFVLIKLANRRVKRQGQNLLPGIRPFEHAPESGLQARNDIGRQHFHLLHLVEHRI
jgi:hypothetical protein